MIDDKVAVVAGFDEQPVVPRLKRAINPKVRQKIRNRGCLILIIIYPSSLELLSAVSDRVYINNSIIIAPSSREVNK